MPRLARSSARCGPTPLIIWTLVWRPSGISMFISSGRQVAEFARIERKKNRPEGRQIRRQEKQEFASHASEFVGIGHGNPGTSDPRKKPRHQADASVAVPNQYVP